MKIIKASVDLETWCHELTCNNCKSVISIEATDLREKWSREGSYYFICVLCGHRQYMKSIDIPEIVKTDVDKHRSDPIVYLND